MQETAAELQRLREVITGSIERAGPFLRSSFEMPAHSLTAEQVVNLFDGVRTVALATSTAAGAPRVAPIGCLLVRARFYIPTTRIAARFRMIRRRPEVSLTLYEGVDMAVIVHGRATPLLEDEDGFDQIEALHRDTSGSSVRAWGAPGDGCYLAIEPETIVSYTRVI